MDKNCFPAGERNQSLPSFWVTVKKEEDWARARAGSRRNHKVDKAGNFLKLDLRVKDCPSSITTALKEGKTPRKD
jgi:hypothetical protein